MPNPQPNGWRRTVRTWQACKIATGEWQVTNVTGGGCRVWRPAVGQGQARNRVGGGFFNGGSDRLDKRTALILVRISPYNRRNAAPSYLQFEVVL